jgi:hypothetical protein
MSSPPASRSRYDGWRRGCPRADRRPSLGCQLLDELKGAVRGLRPAELSEFEFEPARTDAQDRPAAADDIQRGHRLTKQRRITPHTAASPPRPARPNTTKTNMKLYRSSPTYSLSSSAATVLTASQVPIVPPGLPTTKSDTMLPAQPLSAPLCLRTRRFAFVTRRRHARRAFRPERVHF